MQKHAPSPLERYRTVFAPLPVEAETALYADQAPVSLPYAEDFPQLHYHDRYEIGVCEEGEGLFLSDGSFFSVSQGDLIFIPPKVCHYSRSLHREAPCRCRFTYLRADAVARVLPCDTEEEKRTILRGGPIPAVIRKGAYPSSAALLSEIISLGTEGSVGAVGGVSLRIALLLLEAERRFPTALPSERTAPARRGAVTVADTVAEYLALRYREPLSAKDLAAMCHLSESQLRRRFLAAYGMPPIAYRNWLRCRIAAELLARTELSVAEISEQVGYTVPSDFYRAFRSFCGMAPTDYRKRR